METHVIDNQEQPQDNKEKKPFNKKEYRLQKYSNKYKISQWEERRKNIMYRRFYKELYKNYRKQIELAKTSPPENKIKVMGLGAFHKAKKLAMEKFVEQTEKREQARLAEREREEALKQYKLRKIETYKKLSSKTKKGQPVMKDRIEMLLEKIQQQGSWE